MSYYNTEAQNKALEQWKNDNADVFSFETYKDPEAWKIARNKGIGGSDVGAILGLNKFMSPYQVYISKVTGVSKDLSGNTYVNKGNKLEPYIFTEFVRPYFKENDPKYEPVIIKDTIVRKDKEHLRCNVDGLILKEGKDVDGILEIKLVFENSEKNWGGSDYQGIPASYYAQVQYYMYDLKLNYAVVCAFFDRTWEPHFYIVRRDEEFIANMAYTVIYFWDSNIKAYNPPELDIELDKEFLPEKLKEKPEKHTVDANLTRSLAEYREVTNRIKTMELQQKELKTQLVNAYLDGRIPEPSYGKISMIEVTSTTLNTTKIKEELPKLYERYAVKSTYVRTTIK